MGGAELLWVEPEPKKKWFGSATLIKRIPYRSETPTTTEQRVEHSQTIMIDMAVGCYRPIQLTHDNGLVLRLLLLCDPLVLSILQPVHLGHVLPHHLEQVKNVYFPLDQYNFDAKNWFKYSKFNPPGPETFFASDFNFFFICCSCDTPERGLVEKQFFWAGSSFFWGSQKRLLRRYS